MNPINQRFKEVRQALGKTQAEFARSLGFVQSSIAMLERGDRAVSDRHIKAVASIYHINEQWLRTGEGEMYQGDGTLFSNFAKQYDLSESEQRVAHYLLTLTSEDRQQITRLVNGLVDAIKGKPTDEQTEASDHDAARAALHAELDRQLDAEEGTVPASSYGESEEKRA